MISLFLVNKNAEHNHSVTAAHKPCGKVVILFGIDRNTVIGIYIHEKVKNRLKSRSACYRWCKIFYVPARYLKTQRLGYIGLEEILCCHYFARIWSLFILH